jgi:hypothetical protein
VSCLSGRLFESARKKKLLVRSRLWVSCHSSCSRAGWQRTVIVSDSTLLLSTRRSAEPADVRVVGFLLAAMRRSNNMFRLYFAAHSNAHAADRC